MILVLTLLFLLRITLPLLNLLPLAIIKSLLFLTVRRVVCLSERVKVYAVLERCCSSCHLDCQYLMRGDLGQPFICLKKPVNYNQRANKSRTRTDWQGIPSGSNVNKGKVFV